MLQFKAVTKSFKDGNQTIEAVKSTDLSFNQGELIAIVAIWFWKKYFLTMAGALQTPTTGDIWINQQNITQLKQKALARIRIQEIGFILQSTNLVPF